MLWNNTKQKKSAQYFPVLHSSRSTKIHKMSNKRRATSTRQHPVYNMDAKKAVKTIHKITIHKPRLVVPNFLDVVLEGAVQGTEVGRGQRVQGHAPVLRHLNRSPGDVMSLAERHPLTANQNPQRPKPRKENKRYSTVLIIRSSGADSGIVTSGRQA